MARRRLFDTFSRRRPMRRLHENTINDRSAVKQFVSFPDGGYWYIINEHLKRQGIVSDMAESISQIKSILSRYIDDADPYISISHIDAGDDYIEIVFSAPGFSGDISENVQDAIWDAMPQDELWFGIMNIRVRNISFNVGEIVVGCDTVF